MTSHLARRKSCGEIEQAVIEPRPGCDFEATALKPVVADEGVDDRVDCGVYSARDDARGARR